MQAPHFLQMAAQRRDQPTDDGWCAVELDQHRLDLRRCHHHGHPRFTLARTAPLRSPGSTPSTWLLPPMLQPDQGRGLALLKVTGHGIPDLAVQRLQAVCLRVNGGAEGAG